MSHECAGDIIRAKIDRDARAEQRKRDADMKRVREALAVFAGFNAMNPPPGMPLGEWLAAVTSARAALKGRD